MQVANDGQDVEQEILVQTGHRRDRQRKCQIDDGRLGKRVDQLRDYISGLRVEPDSGLVVNVLFLSDH